MPISRIKRDAINDGAISIAKTDSLFVNTEISGTEAARMPQGTTAQRANAASGDIRFNSTNNLMEYYTGTVWKSIDSPPVISSIDYSGSTTAADPAGGETIVLNGDFFSTTGSVLVNIGGTSAPTISVLSSTQIQITTPAKSVGSYEIEVTNPSGLSGKTTIVYSNNPSWNTAQDTVVATVIAGASVNITSLAATDDGDVFTYSETTTVLTGNGANEMNLSLNSGTCAITGTAPSPSSATEYTFTLRATDAEGQSSDRQFKIQVNLNFFGDGSDGSLST